MKRFKAVFLFLFCLCSTPGVTAGAMTPTAYRLSVDGTAAAGTIYEEKGAYMVPLRVVSEGLGYTVTWDGEKRVATADMSIAALSAVPGSTTYGRKGKLKVINLTQDFTYGAPAQIIDGRMYVPAEFFRDLFNNVTITDSVLTIAPQRAYLDGDAAVR